MSPCQNHPMPLYLDHEFDRIERTGRSVVGRLTDRIGGTLEQFGRGFQGDTESSHEGYGRRHQCCNQRVSGTPPCRIRLGLSYGVQLCAPFNRVQDIHHFVCKRATSGCGCIPTIGTKPIFVRQIRGNRRDRSPVERQPFRKIHNSLVAGSCGERASHRQFVTVKLECAGHSWSRPS